ncbi:hypothetical protein ACU4GR_33610 (plasmid) [Methylobacterium oryzae CBMB20]
MSLLWIEALVAMNEDIIACERRFDRQCILVAELAEHGHVTAKNEMLLASYRMSLALVRTQRNILLANVPADA